MVVSWQLLSQSLIPLASVYSRGTRYPPHSLLWPHHRGPMSQELKRQTCCMRSQSHERLWPPLLKLNLEMVGKLVSAAVAVAKSSIPIFNSNSRDFNSIFNSTNFNSNSNSGIGIELQFQFRNWIDPNPGYIWIGIQYQIRGIRVTKDWYFRQCFSIILNSTPMIFHSLWIKCEFTIFDLQLNFLVRFDERKIFEFSNAKSMTCNLEMKSITAMQNPFNW